MYRYGFYNLKVFFVHIEFKHPVQKFKLKTKLCQKLYTVAFKYHEGLIDQSYPVNSALGYKYFQKESYEVPPAYLPGDFLIFSLLYYL